MSDPQRLLREGSDLERTLLRAWDAERPTADARKRALAIGGIGAVVAVGVAGAAKGAGASLAPKAVATTGAWIVKAVIATFVVAASVGAIAILRAPETRAPAAASSSSRGTPAPPVTNPPVGNPPVSNLSLPAVEAALDMPDPVLAAGAQESASPNARAASASRAPQAPAPSPSGLRSQIASLDGVREALDAHDAALALRRLDAYRTTYPDGALSEEADVLRIQALVQNGNRTAAESLAARFNQAHPKSPHARRIRDLLSDGSRAN